MKSQVLRTVWCYITGEAAGEIWHWSLLAVKVLNLSKKNALSERPTLKKVVKFAIRKFQAGFWI